MATDFDEMYEGVERGIKFLWANEYDNAIDEFKNLQTDEELSEDFSYRFKLHHAETVFLRSFLTADEGDTAEALELLTVARDACEERRYELNTDAAEGYENIDDDLDCKLANADALAFLAVLQLAKKSKLSGAWNLRKAWKCFASAASEAKERADGEIHPKVASQIKFGEGLFLWAVGIVPTKYLRIIEFIGFKADKEKGLSLLREVAQDNSCIRQPMAMLLLLTNNTILPRGLEGVDEKLKEAKEILDRAQQQFPQSSFFDIMRSHMARKAQDIPAAVQHIEDALSKLKALKNPPLIIRGEMANCLIMNAQWDKAADVLRELVGYEQYQVRGLASLQLAGCLSMMGKRDEAMQIFKSTSTMKPQHSFDSIVIGLATRYVKSGGPFSAFELLFLRRDLAKMTNLADKILSDIDTAAQDYPDALKEPNVEDIQSTMPYRFVSGFRKLMGKDAHSDFRGDHRVTYCLLRGSVLKEAERFDEAEKVLTAGVRVARAGVCVADWLAPNVIFELGETLYKQKRYQESATLLKECSSYSSFAFSEALKTRLRVAISQVNKVIDETVVEEVTKEEEEEADKTKEEEEKEEQEHENQRKAHKKIKSPRAGGVKSPRHGKQVKSPRHHTAAGVKSPRHAASPRKHSSPRK